MRSSDSIAELAGALAEAQVELQNPPKSLIAYLEPGHDGSPGQAYRYAPLSSGLEIVRKALGQHGIAVVQSTELDRGTGSLMLTTTLAHSSGEWIASSWPVCGAAEMAHPKHMGAALTYARRYSLFALVGLAGEDDLDAPPVTSRQTAGDTVSGEARPQSRTAVRPQLDASPQGETRFARSGGRADRSPRQDTSPPPPGGLTDLTQELEKAQSQEDLMRWSLTSLPACNRLEAPERRALQATFLARAKEVGADPDLLVAFTRRPKHRAPRRTRQAEQQVEGSSAEPSHAS